MKHMKGMAAITNPLVNSYKRLVPGYEAPIYIAWSVTNRSPLIRIPVTRGEGTRVELRCPDSAANPYLTLAVCLQAGLDGIRNQIEPPAAVTENVFEMRMSQKNKLGIEELPADIGEALAEFEKTNIYRTCWADTRRKNILRPKNRNGQIIVRRFPIGRSIITCIKSDIGMKGKRFDKHYRCISETGYCA